MDNKEKFQHIDFFLAQCEDYMHGQDGDDCTKARKYLSELKSEFEEEIKTSMQTSMKEELRNPVKEIQGLFFQFKKEELPDADSPFHDEAEGWATMEFFLEWLKKQKK